jgi:hypothetical protein
MHKTQADQQPEKLTQPQLADTASRAAFLIFLISVQSSAQKKRLSNLMFSSRCSVVVKLL